MNKDVCTASIYDTALEGFLEGELVSTSDVNRIREECLYPNCDWNGNCVSIEFLDGVANIFYSAEPFIGSINIKSESLIKLVDEWCLFLETKKDKAFEIEL